MVAAETRSEIKKICRMSGALSARMITGKMIRTTPARMSQMFSRFRKKSFDAVDTMDD